MPFQQEVKIVQIQNGIESDFITSKYSYRITFIGWNFKLFAESKCFKFALPQAARQSKFFGGQNQ